MESERGCGNRKKEAKKALKDEKNKRCLQAGETMFKQGTMGEADLPQRYRRFSSVIQAPRSIEPLGKTESLFSHRKMKGVLELDVASEPALQAGKHKAARADSQLQ